MYILRCAENSYKENH